MQRGRTHLEPALDPEEMAEELVAARVYPCGFCLICGDEFGEDDCIPGTWFHNCEANLRWWAQERVAVDRVGIFFVVGGALYVESTPVVTATQYGSCLTHDGGHPEFWSELVAAGAVPDEPYEAPPRGRVTYDVATGEFHIYADQCVLRDPAMLAQIREQLNLPISARQESDPHYRCRVCQGAEWVPLLEPGEL